jgi:hypothetical protein
MSNARFQEEDMLVVGCSTATLSSWRQQEAAGRVLTSTGVLDCVRNASAVIYHLTERGHRLLRV